MNATRIALAIALSSVSPLALSAGPSSATELARCAAFAAPDLRLACYDKLAGRATEPVSTAIPAAAGKQPAAAAAAAAAADAAPENFGLSQAQLHKTPVGPASIEAHVLRLSPGQPGSRGQVVLDNGQTWSYMDAEQDARLRAGDKITIRRAALGSFMMTTPSRRSYHVRRAQ